MVSGGVEAGDTNLLTSFSFDDAYATNTPPEVRGSVLRASAGILMVGCVSRGTGANKSYILQGKCPYSPECVEVQFCELRPNGGLLISEKGSDSDPKGPDLWLN
jgi:hypothetical protein